MPQESPEALPELNTLASPVDEQSDDSIKVAATLPPAKAEAAEHKPPVKTPPVTPPACQSLAIISSEADPLLVEIFIEEAEQVAEEINNHWHSWQTDQQDWQSFSDMRRGYHTLKGSGRFVGAELLSEFAWQFENLCNKCLGKKSLIAAEKQRLLQQGIEWVAVLVGQLKDPQHAHQHLDSLAMQTLMDKAALAASESAGNAAAASPPEQKQATAEHRPADRQKQAETLQQELTGIFTQEATQHLKIMQHAVDEGPDAVEPAHIDEDLLRTVHTMHGSAHTAGVTHISDLCQPLEEIIQLVVRHSITLADDQVDLIRACVKQIEDDLAAIDSPAGRNGLDSKLAQELQRLNEALQVLYVAQPVSQAVTSAPENHAPGGMVDDCGDKDEDLCEIFFEEAEDVLAACQAALLELKANSSNSEALAELRRQFHTLKGSSRMAGFMTIGELSHVSESLLVSVVDKKTHQNQLNLSLLQKVLDDLHNNLERAQRGENIRLNDALAAEVERATGITKTDNPARRPQPEKPVAQPDPEVSPKTNPPVIEPGAQQDQSKPVSEASPQVSPQAADPEKTLPADSPADRPTDKVTESAKNFPDVTESAASSSDVTQSAENSPDVTENAKNSPDVAENAKIPMQEFTSVAKESADKEKHEVVRVTADILDGLVNDAGEFNIQRSHLEQVFHALTANSAEFAQTVGRLGEQLRKLEIETEAHILFKHADDQEKLPDFDPLELDRYSEIQQLSRSLAESVSDLSNIKEIFASKIQDGKDVLQKQKVVTTSLKNNLLHTRMVRFTSVESRLQRIVRQAAVDLQKQVDLLIEGSDNEIDRRILNGIISTMEHILRNCVAHGIEAASAREAAGKPARGQINIEIKRAGANISITIEDDGAGIDLHKVKAKAIENGLIRPDVNLTDEEILKLIFKSGLSTASSLTQMAGRGVGMDVVDKDIRCLGGNIETQSAQGRGARFILKLPFTLAISQALLIQAGQQVYALTLAGIESVIQLSGQALKQIYAQQKPVYTYAGHDYSLYHLAALLQGESVYFEDDDLHYPLILATTAEQRLALQVEALLGNKEIVVKPLASHFGQNQGITGATILSDGKVVLILDIPWIAGLAETGTGHENKPVSQAPESESSEESVIMVVDDSITIRKVTTHLLERNQYKVMTARDGIDALQKLQKTVPDVVLLDIEMPRMDGYELAAQMRKDERLSQVPIIMITSRTGDKHRKRALELGIDHYLGKPYNEAQLLDLIQRFESTHGPGR